MAQLNQVADIAAVIDAPRSIPHFWPLLIMSDSKYVISGLTTHLRSWENNGWIGVKNAPHFKRAAYLLKK
jgi:ribonuclease HI